MEMHDANLIKELKDIAKQTSKDGYILSADGDMIRIKSYYNVSDYYVVEVLEHLLKNEQIRELHVSYDKKSGHLRSYKFK